MITMAAEMAGTPAGTAEQLMSAAREREDGRRVADAVEAYIAAGRSFLEDEADTERARRAFDAAEALDPGNTELLFQRARMDAILGKSRDALSKFLTVIRASGQSHVSAMFEAGCMYQELGQLDQAVLMFRRVLDRDSGNVQALVNVARRLQAMGMRPEALNHYLVAAETAFDRGQLGTCRQLVGLVQSMDPLHAKARVLLADLNAAESDAAEKNPDAVSSAHADDDIKAAIGPRHSGSAPTPAPGMSSLSAEVDALRVERDRLKAEVQGLVAAVAAEETELAALRMRRETAANVLAMLQAQVESAKTAAVAEESRPPKRTRKPTVIVRAKLSDGTGSSDGADRTKPSRVAKTTTADREGRPPHTKPAPKKKL